MSQAIYGKINKVMKEMNAISKDRKNTQQNFNFRGIDDVMNELHPRLVDAGIFIVPEVLEDKREERVTKSGSQMTYVILKIKYTFFAEDGSSVNAIMIGEAMDTGDKASNKAQSIALKYACLQVFAIPTEDEKDPDAQSHEVKSKSQAVQKATTPAPQPKVNQQYHPDHDTYETYVIPFGKFKNRKMIDVNVQEIASYYAFIERDAFEKGKAITGSVLAFMKHAEEFMKSRDAQAQYGNEVG